MCSTYCCIVSHGRVLYWKWRKKNIYIYINDRARSREKENEWRRKVVDLVLTHATIIQCVYIRSIIIIHLVIYKIILRLSKWRRESYFTEVWNFVGINNLSHIYKCVFICKYFFFSLIIISESEWEQKII